MAQFGVHNFYFNKSSKLFENKAANIVKRVIITNFGFVTVLLTFLLQNYCTVLREQKHIF
jgi:hypothetical protein